MFEKTLKALEVFQGAIDCVQWDCIAGFNQKIPGRRSSARHQCPSCAFPLDITKITGAHVLNTCYGNLNELRELLKKATKKSFTQADIACTQNVFDKEEDNRNEDAVERFLETQSHMPDEMGQNDEEDPKSSDVIVNRENSYSPELDIFHDYTNESTSRSAMKRSSNSKDFDRKPKRSSVLKTSVKNEPSNGPAFDLFASQVPQRTHENDLLTPFVQRRSTAPSCTGVSKYAQSFGSSATESIDKESDPFTKTIVLAKRQASLDQLTKKEPKLEIEEPTEMPSVSSRSRKNSLKRETDGRRSQSPMSFGEKSMSLKPEQRRSSYGTRRGEVVIINSILNNRIPQLKSAVEAGTCVNEKDNEGKTPLYIAVEQNSLEAVKILVEAGAIINASCGSTFETTLHEAVRKKNLQMVDYLLSKGASMKIRNNFKNLMDAYKNEQRILQPIIPPTKPKIHFVHLIDDKLLRESEKQKLPGKINLVSSEIETATHFVVAVDPKTGVFNISKEHIGEVLKAIIKPGMLVSLDWLKACIKDPSKVDNDRSYAVKKVQWMEGQMFENTIEQWKKTIHKMQPKLFAGCKFYIPRPRYNFLDRASLIEIVRSAGGYASVRDSAISEKDPAPYHNSHLRPNFVIYSLSQDIHDKFRDCTKYNLVSEQWLIEAILSCSIKSPPH
uniref:BRCT domain-containing protein n=1 Tax=Caenorhabditis tropicalis TaxID=1561998 RepID=A0A1I7U3D9_9PELO